MLLSLYRKDGIVAIPCDDFAFHRGMKPSSSMAISLKITAKRVWVCYWAYNKQICYRWSGCHRGVSKLFLHNIDRALENQWHRHRAYHLLAWLSGALCYSGSASSHSTRLACFCLVTLHHRTVHLLLLDTVYKLHSKWTPTCHVLFAGRVGCHSTRGLRLFGVFSRAVQMPIFQV